MSRNKSYIRFSEDVSDNISYGKNYIKNLDAQQDSLFSIASGSSTASPSYGFEGDNSSRIKFYYQSSQPSSGVPVGSRWIDSDTGEEYVYIYNGSTYVWIQPIVDVPSTSIENAEADNFTKGVATFYDAQFDSSSGLITLDTLDGGDYE